MARRNFWTFPKVVLLPFISFSLVILIAGIVRQEVESIQLGLGGTVFFGGLFGLLGINSTITGIRKRAIAEDNIPLSQRMRYNSSFQEESLKQASDERPVSLLKR